VVLARSHSGLADKSLAGPAHLHLKPKPAKALGILIRLGKAALTATNQPSGKPAQPLMVPKGARTHAGIDQMQPRHGMDNLRPQLRFR
jgi:hypothetical protein